MDFRFTPEQEAFRTEVRDFARREWRGDDGGEGVDRSAFDRQTQFRKKLAERGWLTRAWPREWGGLEASHLDQAIYSEEMALAGAPGLDQGVDRVGPTIMLFGNDEQKGRFLPQIASADLFWCQGFSEPGAGSDLASLQTRATRDGDN